MTLPNLLYISPVYPAFSGNGLAMRAGMMLQALAQRYRVYLLVVPIYDAPNRPIAPTVSRLISGLASVYPRGMVDTSSKPRRWWQPSSQPKPVEWSFISDEMIHEAAGAFIGVDFDVVHVFRLYMSPFGLPYVNSSRPPAPRLHLDLDNIESTTRARVAERYRLNGENNLAEIEHEQAKRYGEVEKSVLPRVDRIYVCSRSDRAELEEKKYRCRSICVAPNAVLVPSEPPPTPVAVPFTRPFSFLFVGTLDYYPNEDAVKYFCTDILPLIRRGAAAPFRIFIVGVGAHTEIVALAAIPEVQLIGPVPEVAPWYGQADVVIAPVRAGGGTRIKVLEAMSYQRPVVSTSAGVEGIEVVAGEHVLIGDTPEEFGAQCLSLMRDADRRDYLSRNAYALVKRLYSSDALVRALDACT